MPDLTMDTEDHEAAYQQARKQRATELASDGWAPDTDFLNTEDAFEDAIDTSLPPLSVAMEQQAEQSLRAVRYWRTEIERINAHAEAEAARIVDWATAEVKKLERRVQWHEQGLFAYLESTGKKTVKLINGTLKRLAGRERTEVDAEKFIPWAENGGHADLVRVKVEPIKKAISQWVKANGGELPPGVDIQMGDDSYSVVTDQTGR